MEKKKQSVTPKQEVKTSLDHAIRQYRTAVKWLGDARRYKKTYGNDLTANGQSWKDGIEGELAIDSNKAYTEAARSVMYWRKQVDLLNKKMMNLNSKKET